MRRLIGSISLFTERTYRDQISNFFSIWVFYSLVFLFRAISSMIINALIFNMLYIFFSGLVISLFVLNLILVSHLIDNLFALFY